MTSGDPVISSHKAHAFRLGVQSGKWKLGTAVLAHEAPDALWYSAVQWLDWDS